MPMPCGTCQWSTQAGACFSSDRHHRYALWRRWDDRPLLTAILLNPSIADESQLDPTLRRVQSYAQAWHYGGMIVGNAFDLVSTDPGALRDWLRYRNVDHAVNDAHLTAAMQVAVRVMVGWGSHLQHPDLGRRRATLLRLLAQHAADKTYVWKFSLHGEPVHPLYLRSDIVPIAMPLPNTAVSTRPARRALRREGAE